MSVEESTEIDIEKDANIENEVAKQESKLSNESTEKSISSDQERESQSIKSENTIVSGLEEAEEEQVDENELEEKQASDYSIGDYFDNEIEEEEDVEEEEVPFVSVFERLDAPREALSEPDPITAEMLKQISVRLGQIRLCWPKQQKVDLSFMPNVILPDGYLMNTNKEKLLLLYCENFRQQYHQKFPNRKPLLLAADNVVGQRKMVCTTLRPTTLTFPNLSTWQELAQFVADHIVYQPLNPPTDLVSFPYDNLKRIPLSINNKF